MGPVSRKKSKAPGKRRQGPPSHRGHPAHHVAAANNHPATVFAGASVDAFGAMGQQVYIPTSPATPTQCVTAKAGFTAVADSAGNVFIAIHPTVCKDYSSFTYSNSSTATFSIDSNWRGTATAVTGLSGAAFSTLPYSKADFSAADAADTTSTRVRTFRIPAVGIRVRYLGELTKRGGMAYYLCQANHSDSTQSSLAEIMNNNRHIKFDFSHATNNLFETTVSAIHPWECTLCTEKDNGTYPYRERLNTSNSYWDYVKGEQNAGPAVALVYITGVSSGTKFDVEVIGHFEYNGRDIGPLMVERLADDVGVNHAISAAQAGKIAHARSPHSSVADHAAVAGMSTSGALLSSGGAAIAAENPALGMGLELTGGLLSNRKTDKAMVGVFDTKPARPRTAAGRARTKRSPMA